MGLFDKLKGEFIDIVEWLDPTNDTLVYRFERYQNEIKNGAKLTVREGQRPYLSTRADCRRIFTGHVWPHHRKSAWILSTLKGWKYGFNPQG